MVDSIEGERDAVNKVEAIRKSAEALTDV
jgi:hypothetical protein